MPELQAMAQSYLESGQALRERIKQLNAKLETEPLSSTERVLLRRRITTLTAMARDAAAAGSYMSGYYERKEAPKGHAGKRCKDLSGDEGIYWNGGVI